MGNISVRTDPYALISNVIFDAKGYIDYPTIPVGQKLHQALDFAAFRNRTPAIIRRIFLNKQILTTPKYKNLVAIG